MRDVQRDRVGRKCVEKWWSGAVDCTAFSGGVVVFGDHLWQPPSDGVLQGRLQPPERQQPPPGVAQRG